MKKQTNKKERRKNIVLKEIKRLEEKLGYFIPLEELETSLKNKVKEKELQVIIESLVNDNILYIPRKGFLQRLENKHIFDEQNEQSEKISELLSEIGKLNVRIQQLERMNIELVEKISFKEGHLREKENKLNMIRSIVGPNKDLEK